MPGHKLGRGLPKEITSIIPKLDATEIPGLDNLHHPSGILKEAMELAAKAFGSHKTFFLVNGSTCGIHAMISAVLKPVETLLIGRDCHRSAIGGMMLSGVRPVYIKPGFIKEYGFTAGYSPWDIEKQLIENPDIKAVFITRPNYYGVCSDISAIAEITHRLGRILMVDEAHGAHLKFNERLPVCAMDAGADICVQSAHKTLPAFTQSAYLHVKGEQVDIERLETSLDILQTTSPSYILMASLDIAREIMENEGSQRIDELLENIEWFEGNLKRTTEFIMVRKNMIEEDLDHTRIVINTRYAGLTGFETERLLRSDFGVQVEMSDPSNVVLISAISDTRADFERLLAAFKGISSEKRDKCEEPGMDLYDMPLPEVVVKPGDILSLKTSWVSIENSIGKICLDTITPYPPGIPVVCPGERMTGEIAKAVKAFLKMGGTVLGIQGDMIKVAK